MVCAIAAVTMIGHYSFYTFIVPFMTDVMGVPAGNVSALLFAYGIAGAVGLVLAGSVLGPRPQAGLIIAIVLTAVSVTVLSVFAGQPIVAIGAFVLWGLAFGTLPPLLQTRLLHTSSAGFRDTASAFYTTAFNIGIGGGALVGAWIFDLGGVTELPLVYVGILVVSFVLVLVVGRMTRPSAHTASTPKVPSSSTASAA
jgi:predicted MFS family arabinose efflux permease